MATVHATSLNAERALQILLILGEEGQEGLSLSQISKRVGGGKSAAHRSITALLHKGFAEPAGRYGHYRLGPTIALIAKQQERLEPEIQKFRPGMTEFSRRTGFTVFLLVQAGVDAVCAEMISRSSQRQFKMGVGARVPMGVAAGSVALLSLLPEKTAAGIIADNAQRYLHYPALVHVDSNTVSGLVASAREQGYSVNMGYYLPELGGLGLPIPGTGPYGVNVAISFNAPLELMNPDWIRKTIGELRECLGAALPQKP